jgi:hypothetical protein
MGNSLRGIVLTSEVIAISINQGNVLKSNMQRNLRPRAIANIIHGRQRGVLLNFQIKKPTATSPNIMLIIFGSIRIKCQKIC